MKTLSVALALAFLGGTAIAIRAQSAPAVGPTLGVEFTKLFTSGAFASTGPTGDRAYFTRPLLLGLSLQVPTPISSLDARVGVGSTLGGRFEHFDGSPRRSDAGIAGTYVTGLVGLVLNPPQFRGGLAPYLTAGMTLSGWRLSGPANPTPLTEAVRTNSATGLGWFLGGGLAWDLASAIVAPELIVRFGENRGTLSEPRGWRRSAALGIAVRVPLARR